MLVINCSPDLQAHSDWLFYIVIVIMSTPVHGVPLGAALWRKLASESAENLLAGRRSYEVPMDMLLEIGLTI